MLTKKLKIYCVSIGVVLSIILLFGLATVLIGCANVDTNDAIKAGLKASSQMSLPPEKEILGYLEEKYPGYKFAITDRLSFEKKGWVLAVSDKYPAEKFSVSLINSEGDISINYAKDGFQMLLGSQEITPDISSAVHGSVPAAKVSAKFLSAFEYIEGGYDSKAGLNGLLSNPDVSLTIRVVLPTVESWKDFSRDDAIRLATNLEEKNRESYSTAIIFAVSNDESKQYVKNILWFSHKIGEATFGGW